MPNIKELVGFRRVLSGFLIQLQLEEDLDAFSAEKVTKNEIPNSKLKKLDVLKPLSICRPEYDFL